MSISFKMTIPKPNLKWYKSAKKELLAVTEKYNRESWEKESDPVTGKKWAPRKQPTGKHPLLKKSGKMLGSTKFKATDKVMDFRARTTVNYGGFHQRGTSKMPQRRWLGIGERIVKDYAPIMEKHLFKGKYTFTAP